MKCILCEKAMRASSIRNLVLNAAHVLYNRKLFSERQTRKLMGGVHLEKVALFQEPVIPESLAYAELEAERT